jgi:hypothetical protein
MYKREVFFYFICLADPDSWLTSTSGWNVINRNKVNYMSIGQIIQKTEKNGLCYLLGIQLELLWSHKDVPYCQIYVEWILTFLQLLSELHE